MNIPSRGNSAERGATLLLTLVVTGLIVFLLAAYLGLVQHQSGANFRSQSWNSAMPVVEAGIEEALQHLNKNGATNGNLATDGWKGGGSTFTITRAQGDAFYSVTIRDFYVGTISNRPLIESKGYVTAPLVLGSVQGALLASVSGSGEAHYLGRGVRVRTRQDFIFSRGMVARDSIDMNGNNIRSDSFDSSDPLYSTNGAYNPLWFKDNGDIAVNASLTNSLNIGNADIWGHVSVGPSGTIAVGSKGAIGSSTWHDSGKGGTQPGWTADDMNVSFPDVTPPFSSGGIGGASGGWITNKTTGVATYYDYILDSGNYQMVSMHGTVYVRGAATVYVTDSLDISGLTIESGAGKLNLYSSASSVSLVGNTPVNGSGNAADFAFWGLPSVKDIKFSGNAAFIGTIYAPNAEFTLNGGGKEIIDFIGSSITKTVRMNGHFNFHYDEALRRFGPVRGYIVDSWNEMTPSEVPQLNLSSVAASADAVSP